MSNKKEMAAMTTATEKPALVPRLRFPEFRANPPWVPRELSRLLTSISNGITLPQNNSGLGLRVTRIETIADGKIDLNRVGYVDAPPNEIEGHQLKAGDILISNINSIAHIGKSVLINENIDVYHGMNLLRLQVDVGSNSPKFIHFSINTPNVRESIRKRANKAVNQASINQTELGRTIVPSPPLPEQQKIADCLTSLDDLITLESQKLDTLKRHKKGLMQQLFPAEGETVPRLRFPEFRDTDEWKRKALGEIGEIVTGKTPSTNDDSLWDGDIQFVTPTDISEEKYQKKTQRSISRNSKTKVLPTHSIMFTCIASIGKIALSVKPCITNQQINSIIPHQDYANEFIYYSLISITPLIKSTQANSTLPIINKTEFSKFTVAVPKAHGEQKKISDSVSSLDDLITAQNQKIETLKTHKKGLMQQLFPMMGEVQK